MITRAYVKNFKSLSEVDVGLDRLTVLVGPNGSGKSNFIDFLRFISEAFSNNLQYAIEQRHGITSLYCKVPRKSDIIDIELELEVESFLKKINCVYEVEIHGKKPKKGNYFLDFSVKRELCDCKLRGKRSIKYEILNGEWIKKPKVISEKLSKRLDQTRLTLSSIIADPFWDVRYYMRDMNFYNIYPQYVREITKPLSEYPLETHGKNITSVLRHMQSKYKNTFTELIDILGKIIPGIVGLDVKQIGGYLTLRFKHEDKNKKNYELEAYQESDGTLRILGILVALFQKPSPSLLAIEEPELTVHPGVLGILADLIKEASERRSQVIITTHSPDLISHFEAKNLRVVEWSYRDGTTIGAVDETQIEIINEKLFSCGDLLRIEGLRTKR